MTGEEIILNTSFNLHSVPIVYTPQHALATLDNSGLQYRARQFPGVQAGQVASARLLPLFDRIEQLLYAKGCVVTLIALGPFTDALTRRETYAKRGTL